MLGYIILRDLPKTRLTIDGTLIEIKGKFRGFHSVPPGKHSIGLETTTGEIISIVVDVPSGDAVVKVFKNDPPRLTNDNPAKEQRYQLLAIGGVMGNALLPYPMPMNLIEAPDAIATILSEASRVSVILAKNYQIAPIEVMAIGVNPNSVEFRTASQRFTFRMSENQQVFLPSTADIDEEPPAQFDPLLWGNLKEIIDAYAESCD